MNRFRFSTAGLNFPPKKPKAVDPADANLSPEWNETIGKLGFTAVVIQLERCPKTFENAEFLESLGEEMNRARLGHLDSSQWQPHPNILFFFYADTSRLGEALKFLKSRLGHHGLLKHSFIGHFDEAEKIWRIFNPGIEL